MTLKIFLQNLLASFARRILSKYKPKVIGITGSVGKTSTREAVFLAVSQKFKARKSQRNFNTEFGLPFTIIGVGDPGRNPFKWLAVFGKAIGLLILPLGYPKFLILEMGVEFPDDMDVLLKIVHPNIAIITGIGISHYEFFKDQDSINREKGRLADALTADELLLVNADNAAALSLKDKTKAKVISYGLYPGADVTATQIDEHIEENKYSTTIAVKYGKQSLTVKFHAVGKPHIQAIICGAAVGLALEIEKDLIERGLSAYKPIPGRLNIFSGLMHSIIIDDTYNAAPDSMREALELLGRFPGSYKIAVLGDMLELGDIAQDEHTKMGQAVLSFNINRLITVGPQAKLIAQAAIAAGVPESKVSSFDSVDSATSFVRNLIEANSVILLKGSQGMRLEKITKEIMAEPMRAQELLPRQYGKWLHN